MSSECYRSLLFCLLILRFVLCVKNETEPESHWNHATITARIPQEEKVGILFSSDILKKDPKDCLEINGDVLSSDTKLEVLLSQVKNYSQMVDGNFNSLYFVTWMEACLNIMNGAKYTMLTNNRYSYPIDFLYYGENEINVGVEEVKNKIKAFKIALSIHKNLESIRDLIISKTYKFVNISYCIGLSRLIKQCLSSSKKFRLFRREHAVLKHILMELESSYRLRYLIEPIVSVTLFCIGMIFSGTLLLIFYKHREIRILSNIVILNIAINDLLCLVIVLPLQYIVYNYHNDEYVSKYVALMNIQNFCSYVSVCSILTLSIQRYLAISKNFNTSKSQSEDLKFSRIAKIILPIWGTSGIIVAFFHYINIIYRFAYLSFIVLGGLIIPIIVSVLNFRTAKRMYKSAQNIPGEGSQTRLVNSGQRSSYILMGLITSFWITHTPFFILSLFIAPGFMIYIPRYIATVIFHLFISNAILNPLSLYITSSVFRELFKKIYFGVG